MNGDSVTGVCVRRSAEIHESFARMAGEESGRTRATVFGLTPSRGQRQSPFFATIGPRGRTTLSDTPGRTRPDSPGGRPGPKENRSRPWYDPVFFFWPPTARDLGGVALADGVKESLLVDGVACGAGGWLASFSRAWARHGRFSLLFSDFARDLHLFARHPRIYFCRPPFRAGGAGGTRPEWHG